MFTYDRCPAQSLALKRVFGADATVVNCAVHIGRNIKQNAGQNSELRSRFWAMRRQRTAEAEESFVASLRQLHAVRRSNFTTSLLNALEAFLPSKADPFLKCPVFPSVHRLKSVDLSAFAPTTPAGLRAKQTLVELQSVADVFEDVFSRDNTNSIEGYFGIIKRRLKKNTSTLLDLFNAVDFTEASALARSDPARPRVPPDLSRCILRSSLHLCLSHCQNRALTSFSRSSSMSLSRRSRQIVPQLRMQSGVVACSGQRSRHQHAQLDARDLDNPN